MKVQEAILRAMAKKITWWQAAEILGQPKAADLSGFWLRDDGGVIKISAMHHHQRGQNQTSHPSSYNYST